VKLSEAPLHNLEAIYHLLQVISLKLVRLYMKKNLSNFGANFKIAKVK
jgi:hypothetical protein